MRLLLLLSFILIPVTLQAGTQVYSDRTTFESLLSTSSLDDYENPGYVFSQSDLVMSGVLNETKYTTTGFPNNNLVPNNGPTHVYCAGCNGSFRMDFTSTSLSGINGVDAVGFDYINSSFLPYHAFLKFGDGTTSDYPLLASPFEIKFFGISSDKEIASIHLGEFGGQQTTSGYFEQDNLILGRVIPEPSSICLCMGSIVQLGIRRRR